MQTFSASGAQIDPAVELGVFAAAGNICGGIFEESISLGPLYSADIAAPAKRKSTTGLNTNPRWNGK